MIRIFIDQATESMQQIRLGMKNKDYKLVNETAHRIKASIINLGILSIKTDMSDMERIAAEEPGSIELPNLVKKVDKVISRVITQLKKELK